MNEIVGGRDTRKKGVVDTARGRLWHGVFKVNSKAKERCPKERDMGQKRMKSRF